MLRRLSLLLSFCVLIALAPSASATVDRLESVVAKKAAIVEIMHRKARKALVNAAQDRTYGEYFGHSRSDGERDAIKGRIDRISLRVQSRFHVEEMCLIDPEGAEISRIVGNQIADDLSDEEAQAIFFAPGFAQGHRQVHTSPAYISPDVDKWVVAYVTPVVTEGQKRAILHYEHDLGVFQQVLNQDFDGDDRFVLAIDEEGWVVSDSRRAIPLQKRDGSMEHGDYFQQFRLGGMTLPELQAALGGEARKGAGRVSNAAGDFGVAYQAAGRWTLLVVERS